MPESQYIQDIRQMVRDFNASDQQRKTAEEQAQQTYRAECASAEAELRRQQQILNASKVEAKARQDAAQQAANTKLNNARNDAASKLATAKEAQKKALSALERVSVQANVSNISFQKPSTANLNPLTELAKSATMATDTAQKVQQEIWDLEQLRDKDAKKLQRRQEIRTKILTISTIFIGIFLFILLIFTIKTWHVTRYYNTAMKALQEEDWGKALDALNMVNSLRENYKDTQTLLKNLKEHYQRFTVYMGFDQKDIRMNLNKVEIFLSREKIRLSLKIQMTRGNPGTIEQPRQVYLKIGNKTFVASQFGGYFGDGNTVGTLQVTKDKTQEGWIEFTGISEEVALGGCFDFHYGTAFTFNNICLK